MRRGARHVAIGMAAGILAVGVLLLGAVLVLTQTDWGREQVRRFAVTQLNRAADGEVAIGRVEGNLLRGLRLVDVSIIDSDGRPFVQADTLATRFSLRSFLRRRIALTDMRLVNARIVLDKPPGEDWNWVRIFPRDPDAVAVRRPGWGDWIRMHDVTLVDSEIEVRTAWSPSEDLTAEEREDEIRAVLAGETRKRVEEVGDGYQNVIRIRQLNAELPLIFPAHPDSAVIPIEVARLSAIVEAFLPPPAVVRNLSGSIRVSTDSLFFRNVDAVLPGSRLSGDGVYALDSGDLLLRVQGAPLAFNDLRWLYPNLPDEGGGTLHLTVHDRSLHTRIIGRDMDLRVADATLTGDVDLQVGDTLRLRHSDIQFARVPTSLIERVAPNLEMPRQGLFTGEMELAGTADAMRIDGDVRFDDAVAGASRMRAVGRFALEPELRFDDLRLRFEPLQAELLRVAVPQLPLRGTIEGFANLTGRPAGDLQLDSDLTLRDPRAGRSRVRATGGVDMRDELRLRNLLVRFDPLRLDLLRDEVPELPAGATLAGRVRLDGVPGSLLAVDGDLTLVDPVTGTSRVAATGGIDMRDELRLQNLLVRFDPLRLDLLRARVPELPAGATLAGRMRLDGVPSRSLVVDGEVTLADPATGTSRVAARGGIDMRDELRLRDLFVRFDPLQLDLLRARVPELPAGATLAGQMTLDGVPARSLAVDGEVTLADPVTGTSRVAATGAVAYADELVFRDLRLRFDPLRLDLARGWLPDLPAGATLTGPLRLNGAASGVVNVDGALALTDPASGLSRVSAAGGVSFQDELRFHALRVETDPLRLDLLRRWAPELPPGAAVTGSARLDGAPGRMLAIDGSATIQDPATGVSRVAAAGGIRTAGGTRFDRLQLRFEPVQMSLIRTAFPDLPGTGTLAGRLWLDGDPGGFLRLDADLRHDDPNLGPSQVAAVGGVNLGDGPRFDGLRLDLQPLRMELVQALVPDLPLGGTLTGRATLDGSPDHRLDIRGDIAHREGGEYSRVTGHATFVPGGAGWASVDVNLLPLSLGVVGRFVPEAGLRGSVTGALTASGDLRNLSLATNVQVAGGGDVEARGTLDLAGDATAYDLAANFRNFDASAVTTRAPASTSLTGPLTARGRGFEPGTMRMNLAADLTESRVADLAADRLRLRVAIADGLATSDSSVIRIGETVAAAHGSFGLVAGREGVLTYRIDTGSLESFAPLAIRAEEGVRTGRLPRRRATPPTLGGEPLAGALSAEGTLRGNVTRFDASGRAVAENLVAAGNEVGRGWVTYTLQGIGTEQAVVRAQTELHAVRAQGMSFDRLSAELDYTGGRFGAGHAIIAAHADDATDLFADARFALSLDRRELQLDDLALRVDTVSWRTTRPALISWGAAGVELQAVHLASNVGGSIQLDGRLPLDGAADLDIEVVDLEIGHVLALLQIDEDSGGRLSMNARMRGTRDAPVLEGTAVLSDGFLDGRPLPDTRAEFSYRDRELVADAELAIDGRLVAIAEARLPIDLRLTAVEGPRLLDGPLALDIRADSLPLDAIPGFTEQVQDVVGRVSGDFSVRGTFQSPSLDGNVDVDLETLRVVPLGVTFEDIVGSLVFDGGALRVDSLRAWSGGPIYVAGEVGLASLLEPSFDLTVDTENAVVIDTDRARLRLDAQVAITGPFDAIEVTGDVQTRSGVIYIPELSDFGGGKVVNLDDPAVFARADTILRAERDALTKRSELLKRLNVDLAFVVDRDVWLRSREANVEIYTPQEVGPLHLRLNGESGAFSLYGTINTDRGEYEFMSRRFVLTRGSAIFTGEPEFNPILQVAAEHEVRIPTREALSIRVVLDGELRSLSINIESTAQPPIPQTDLLSYLAFGRDASSLLAQQGSALSGEGTLSGGLVGNVAGLATQQLTSIALEAVVEGLERDAMQAMRLDVFRITPADVPAEVFTGSYLDVLRGTEVEAGRYVSPRLFVAGQLRAASMVPGVRVEYQTPQGFQWITSWAPRFVPAEPTLEESEPNRRRVFGSFLFREWRF
jgi:translocation and assembly module TamB